MTDHIDNERRSENMRRIRSKDTKPELLIRKALHKQGYRYRLHVKNLPGHPDIVLRKHRTIIEIRGCFWHAHDCGRGNRPKSNTAYWDAKIKYNIERDRKNEEKLRELGWRVIVIWECQCSTAAKLRDTIKSLSAVLQHSLQ